MEAKSDIRSGLIVGIIVACTAVLVLMLGGLRAWFFQVKNEIVVDQVLTVSTTDLAARRAQEDSLLATYGWVDSEKGVVRIPIDEAMKLVVRESRAGGSGGQ
jgi:hypothetical protein